MITVHPTQAANLATDAARSFESSTTTIDLELRLSQDSEESFRAATNFGGAGLPPCDVYG
jgi:hypothetical protein